MLRFTAGEDLDVMRADFENVISSYELAIKLVREFEKNVNFPPLAFSEIYEYERGIQIISFCYLLHRRDLLPRVLDMFDPAYAGTDTLYEDLLSFFSERDDVDEWYHDKPYRDLINSYYRDTHEESVLDICNYVKKWYAGMEKCPWHNSHLEIEDDELGPYSGYWAIEAAAYTYLLGLDDTDYRENIVYPKDLVDYARKFDDNESMVQTSFPNRVEGGMECPRTGYWLTPARQNSRALFQQGAIMPKFDEPTYGATIWQWDENQ